MASYFDILDVPVAVDEATLTRRFHEMSRIYHPDRWATADTATQTDALDSIGAGQRRLPDPCVTRSRAPNICCAESVGRARTIPRTATAKPPQELFAQVLELQEALMEYQEARLDDDDATMARLRPDTGGSEDRV